MSFGSKNMKVYRWSYFFASFVSLRLSRLKESAKDEREVRVVRPAIAQISKGGRKNYTEREKFMASFPKKTRDNFFCFACGHRNGKR